jgi:hypothetical protein
MTNLVEIPKEVFNYMIQFVPPQSQLALSETAKTTKQLFNPEKLYYSRREVYIEELNQRILQNYHNENVVWDFVDLLNLKYEIFGDLEIIDELNLLPLKVGYWIVLWMIVLSDRLNIRCNTNSIFVDYLHIILNGYYTFLKVYDNKCKDTLSHKRGLFETNIMMKFLRNLSYKYYDIFKDDTFLTITVPNYFSKYYISGSTEDLQIFLNAVECNSLLYGITYQEDIYKYIDNFLYYIFIDETYIH